MGDDSSRSIVKSLKKEWALFLEAFQGDDEADKNDASFEDSKVEAMSLDRVRQITKGLTEDRKKLNQKLETLSKELDLNSAKLESLRLVGGDEDETLNRIHELNDLGQSMAEALAKLDKKLREVRTKELEIQEA
ncbi:hypothetical protein [Bdellovibrio sp. NC01]|uniref:hypothetical protein n=1 Tax=Bdellovibrio sp. NC01 TaxID=2220073 RepID=UPI00115882B8|nr:hypothetical protein [Bdellovibrio sp. NC01]QDK39219.1 hypothetical protein DOE51_17295 [Bdellovibrio sp. NC01]